MASRTRGRICLDADDDVADDLRREVPPAARGRVVETGDARVGSETANERGRQRGVLDARFPAELVAAHQRVLSPIECRVNTRPPGRPGGRKIENLLKRSPER